MRIRCSMVLGWLALAVVATAAENDLMKEKDPGRLVAVLRSAEASLFDKAKACQRLAAIGTPEAVPVLARLLDDQTLAHYARFGLEAMPFSAVDEALRDAMGRLSGPHLVGVINSIGFRRDAQAVPALIQKLGDSDPQVAAAAAAALGRIATPEAARALLQRLAVAPAELKPALGDACLTCGEQLHQKGQADAATAVFDALRGAEVPTHIRLAATLWAIRVRKTDGVQLAAEQLQSEDPGLFRVGLHAAHEISGLAMTQALIEAFNRAPPARQALIAAALGRRPEPAATRCLLQAAKSPHAPVRSAAIVAIAKRAEPAAAAILLDAAVSDDPAVAQAARDGLVNLPGKDVDQAILARLAAPEAKVRRAAIELAGLRRIAQAAPALTRAMDDPEEGVRQAALRALALVIDPQDLSVLIERLKKASAPADRDAARNALKVAAMRSPDREAAAGQLIRAMAGASPENRIMLLELLGDVGGKAALEAVAKAARDPSPEIQDAATRVLGEWMSPDAGPVLLELAKTAANTKFRVRALRGYIRVARQLQMPMAERAAMLRQALAAAWRDDERELVLDVLSRERNPSPEYLALALSQLEVPSLKQAAAAAAVSIADKLVRTHPAEVTAAMQKVLQAAPARATQQKAKQVLSRARG